jgi:membrane fusion protein (multidrug efflux system)
VRLAESASSSTAGGGHGLWPLPAIALAALIVGGCGEPAAQGGPHQPPAPEVNVVTVQARDIPVTYEHAGQTEGVREVEVRSRVTGILLKRNFTEGARVSAGESLFSIDPAPFQATLVRTEAELARSEARLAQAKREVARVQSLIEENFVSRKALDDAISAQEIAAADVNAARAQVTQARLDLEYTRVEAPISGVTGRSLMSEGGLVEAQQTLLTTITQVDPIYVIFGIPETEYLQRQRDVAAGQMALPKDRTFDVRVKLADGVLHPRTGKLDFADVRVNPQTGSIEVRAVIPNDGQLLRPGQFVRAIVEGGVRPAALAVPQRAVLEGPSGKMVLLVNAEGKVEPRPVQIGEWAGQDWIITGGLNPGDRVIVDGMVKARPGAPVQVAELKPEAAPAQPGAAPKQP